MKLYSNFSKLISLWIILLSSNLNAQSTSKRGSFNFDFGIPMNNKMQMITGNSSSRTSSSNSKMFFTFDLGYSHRFFRKFDYQVDLFYFKSEYVGPVFNLQTDVRYVGENVYTVFSMQDVRLNLNIVRDFKLGEKFILGFNAGLGFHILPYGWNLTVSHYYSEKQDSSIKVFPELAKNIKMNTKGYQGFNYLFGIKCSRQLSDHFSIYMKLLYSAIEYSNPESLGAYFNVFKEIGGGKPSERGRSLNYGFQRQEIYSCTLGISYKFK